jgi:hypothetical protein
MSSFDWGGSGGSGTSPDADSSTKGLIKLTNNLGGTADLPEVVDLTITGEQLGSILYHNGTDWIQLPPGSAGRFLSTNGIGLPPSWEVSPSAVDATNLANGILRLANDLGGTASAPEVVDLTISGQAQGSILYFNGTNWVQLSPGTSGQILSTNGAGQNPSWKNDSVTLNKGTASLNFGAAPGGNYASTNVTSQTGISTSSSIKVWISESTTADHNGFEHLMLNMASGISFGNIINNVGFTIYVLTELRLSGTFLINWEWV